MKLTADWICGFVEGEGSFVIYIAKGKSPNSYQVRLFFKVAQHEKNVQLLYALKKYFGVGLVKRQKKSHNRIGSLWSVVLNICIRKLFLFLKSIRCIQVKNLIFLDFAK